MVVLDTLKAAKTLKQAGFDETQAEAVVATIGDALGDQVTKADLEPLATKAELKAAMAELRADLYRALWLQAAGIIGLVAVLLRFLG